MPRRTRLCAHTRKLQPDTPQQTLKAPRLNVQPLNLPDHFGNSSLTVNHSSIVLVDINRRDDMTKEKIDVNQLVENTIQDVFPPTNNIVTYEHDNYNVARIAPKDILRISITITINDAASNIQSPLEYIVTMQIHDFYMCELRLYEKTMDGFQLNHFYFPTMQQ
ncbi:hypothetical protein GE061_005461 [Apolygus lucorum]|uniref:Uncharacterized protein n=1 Tax=Apolygus lucorum TaxID=248454 RepID=A0A8S9WXP7_APOLU|nr:hypothetical protein GE061_005461 [Apolygus lucorum]